MHILFEHLHNIGVIRGNEIDDDRIAAVPVSTLIDWAEETAELTSASNLKREDSVFAYSASLSLGGDRWPCSCVDCRRRHVRSLAQFAALYSDKVYIHNFLGDIAKVCHHNSNVNDDEIRSDFFDDLTLLQELQPLIEAGRIVPLTVSGDICIHCLAKHSFGTGADKRIDKERRKLRRRFETEISASAQKYGGELYLHVSGIGELLDGNGFLISATDAAPIREKPNLMRRLQKGEEIKISRTLLRELQIPNSIAEDVIRNIYFELAAAESLNTSFLTDKIVFGEVLESLSQDEEIGRRNRIIQNHLTALVPFVENVEFKDLLRIRSGEESAFILFRQKLDEAIDAVRQQGPEFTERDAAAIYGDILEPGLANLDVKIKSAKRSLLKKTVRDTCCVVGAIGFGMYLGLVQSEIAAAAKALGMIKIAADIASTAWKSREVPENVKNDAMYFLWQVRQRAKKSL